MSIFKLTLEYDGTKFNGWQIQAQKNRTIQGELEKALKRVFKKKARIFGSGRTDSGVHALGQVGHFKINSGLSAEIILKALNTILPKDIVVISVNKEVSDNFHSQYSAKTKTYRYTILNRDTRSALQRDFCLFYPCKLNLHLMRQESKVLLGVHDFKSFQAADTGKMVPCKEKSTTRRIKRIEIRKKGDFVYIDIEGTGFLYKMVRNIVGTLLAIGRGKLLKGSMARILAQRDRNAAASTAPAKGLCLLNVQY